MEDSGPQLITYKGQVVQGHAAPGDADAAAQLSAPIPGASILARVLGEAALRKAADSPLAPVAEEELTEPELAAPSTKLPSVNEGSNGGGPPSAGRTVLVRVPSAAMYGPGVPSTGQVQQLEQVSATAAARRRQRICAWCHSHGALSYRLLRPAGLPC
jgi:hypothetical protein